MPEEIQIVPLPRHASGVRRFLNVGGGIYRDDPHWVAPLWMDMKKVFSAGNPLFQHAEMQLWVAVRGGKDVGRIAGIVDAEHNRVQRDCAAFFGFFESQNDPAIARKLVACVENWARHKGLQRILGPMNPTANDECGVLIDGFNAPPVLMMTYNPPWYGPLLEHAGLRKAKDLLAYVLDIGRGPRERLEKLAARAKSRHPDLILRPITKKNLAADLGKIKTIYNAAWEKNWGFVPMSDGEIDFMAARLKPLLSIELSWLLEIAGEPAGFLLILPDFNVAFKPLRGRLLHGGLFKALPYLLNWKRPEMIRVLTLGVIEKFRGAGLESVLLAEGLRAAADAGFTRAEASWVLEDNLMMNRIMEVFGGTVYKTYRIYDKPLETTG
ncbi:MAG: hypothetical protein KA004_07790 [Verrucomicrobiales bacterium]|nr:hypothetical protein [Verrucomicrobiales bacterium]